MDRLTLALVLAVATAHLVDYLAVRRGLDPPGFRHPARRFLAGATLALVFFLGVFLPAATADQLPAVDPETLRFDALFHLHLLLLAALAVWYALGYLGVHPLPVRGWPELGAEPSGFEPEPPTVEPPTVEPPTVEPRAVEPRAAVAWGRRLGIPVRQPGLELGIGLVTGVGVWLFVLLAAALLAAVLDTSGILDLSQSDVPPLILWMAALPPALRLLISVSAGVVEELFFRGFLQPRAGIALSTALFVVGHVGYGEPFMLFGLTLLSLFYAFLVAWRRSIWAAVAAHTLFDAVQLLLVIPYAIELQGLEDSGQTAPPLTLLW